jgi:hypothetical protein
LSVGFWVAEEFGEVGEDFDEARLVVSGEQGARSWERVFEGGGHAEGEWLRGEKTKRRRDEEIRGQRAREVEAERRKDQKTKRPKDWEKKSGKV